MSETSAPGLAQMVCDGAGKFLLGMHCIMSVTFKILLVMAWTDDDNRSSFEFTLKNTPMPMID